MRLEHEDTELILDTLKRFAERRLASEVMLQLDREDRCPEELIRELLGPEVGLQLAFIPEAYGGMGGSAQAIFRICEALARVDLGLATSVLGVSLGTDPLRVGGTEEQKAKWMTRVADEGLIAAYAVTEPSAGSDLSALRSRAEPVIESGRTTAYVLNGSKQFITNGGIADIYTVLARTPRGPSFFVVERSTPGLQPGPAEHKHGIRASNTTALSLDDVRVPAENLVGGEEGLGLIQAQQVFGYTRLMVAAFGLGCGNAALERAVAYGRERVQGGSALIDKRAWTHKLIVPQLAELEAARATIEQVAEQLDQGGQDLATEGAVAKLCATEAGNAAADAALQAHGGYGYIQAYEVEKIRRDVRITCIYEGTSEILQQTIARDRWRQHLQSGGGRTLEAADALDSLARSAPDCGADTAALGCRAAHALMETCRQHRLTRNQHVLFSLGGLLAGIESASAFAHKAGRGEPRSSRLTATQLSVLSRIRARRAARRLLDEGLALVAGSGALAGEPLARFERELGAERIRRKLVGDLADLDSVAEQLAAD
ncbi:MAG: acyl-CoA dehydrogenase family protein [Deltaproteobacteria bacterium]|nr:acyl-CoA dehydrogenase family protein [Deltaproteobacteria bacterium]